MLGIDIDNLKSSTQNIVVSMVNKQIDKTIEDTEEIMEKEEEDSSETTTASSQTKSSEETLYETCKFLSIFPLVGIFLVVSLLFLYSFYGLYQSYRYYSKCDTYPWFYLAFSNTLLLLVNYSCFKGLRVIEHPLEYRFIIPVVIIVNGLFSLWGKSVILDPCISDTQFAPLRQSVQYHYYLQLALSIASIPFYLILLSWHRRRNRMRPPLVSNFPSSPVKKPLTPQSPSFKVKFAE